jgi:hypothetical protein
MAKNRVRLALTGVAAIILCSVCPISQTAAQTGNHGNGHAQHHDEYREWKQPGSGLSCCNDQDCRPTRAYLSEDGWRAWDGTRWLPVPWSAVLDVRARDGRTHLCATPGGHVYCLVPADPKS